MRTQAEVQKDLEKINQELERLTMPTVSALGPRENMQEPVVRKSVQRKSALLADKERLTRELKGIIEKESM